MSNYSAIAETGELLVKLLRENLVPKVILNSDSIGLCNPADRGDYTLGVNLYDVRESEEMFPSGMRDRSVNEQKYPSKFMTLFYMVTVYSNSDLKYKAMEEQKIVGKVIQILMDNNLLKNGQEHSNPARIEMLRISRDERGKIWSEYSVPYKLSLFYKVYPIEIESAKTRIISRVRETEFTFKEQKGEMNDE